MVKLSDLFSWVRRPTNLAPQPSAAVEPERYVVYDGEKFPGGYGATEYIFTDYWTLRARSVELFKKNLYARGILRRLITNEINTGLTPEAAPQESILAVEEGSLDEWTEDVETRFNVWGRCAGVCDWYGQETFGQLQRTARLEALVAGDVLVVLRQDPITKRPKVQLISGAAVQTPLVTQNDRDADIRHGVEYDDEKRIVAYWILDDHGKSTRVPAYGPKSGRRMAWLVFGTEKRLDETRGEPLLSLVLQSLKEVDRYRDSVQRKALVGSFVAMFIKKGEDKLGTLPISGAATLHSDLQINNDDSETRTFRVQDQIPGMVMEELQTGEEPVPFNSHATDLSFGEFEEAIIQAVAWGLEIPPEILRLAFSSNYSASQAAILEFRIYLNRVWATWGETFCGPIYEEWLISEIMAGSIQANGLLEARADPLRYAEYGAWMVVDWYGSIKPSTDPLKQVKGSQLLLQLGLTTYARESRVTTGTKFTRNLRRLKREHELLAEAVRPWKEFQQEFSGDATQEEEIEDEPTNSPETD